MRNFRRVTLVRAVSLIVIFVFFFAQAFFAQAPAASVEDRNAAARAFERKIAGKLKPGQSVTLSLQNMSSLSPDETALVRKELEMELRAQGLPVKANGRKSGEEGVAEIRVTLAENSQGLLWVAEIGQGENRAVVMQEVARTAKPESATNIPAMLLRSEKILEQGTPILDFKVVDLPAGSATGLLVLELARVALYRLDQSHWQLREAAPLPTFDFPQRDLHGSLGIMRDYSFVIVLPGKDCGGVFSETLRLQCSPWGGPHSVIWPAPPPRMHLAASSYSVARIQENGQEMELDAETDGLARLFKSDDSKRPLATFAGWGSDLAGVKTGCGSGWQILVTRASDYTERDTVQAYEITGTQAMAVSPALELAGPVMALHAAETTDTAIATDTALAVVRNLRTGRYEAQVLSISCGR